MDSKTGKSTSPTNITSEMIADICSYYSVTNVTCCATTFDNYLNWTFTFANSTAIQKCPSHYNQNENATRFCQADGSWALKANYDRCIVTINPSYHIVTTWFIGYTVSTIALWIALVLLRYFRSLRCLRNEIHCNLIASFIVRVFTWYMLLFPQVVSRNWPITAVNITTTIYLFSQMANGFWMLVEGLYLFTIIVWTYGVDRFKIWHYSLVGWGIPLIMTSVAAISIAATISTNENWFSHSQTNQIKMIVIYIPILISIIVNVFVMAVIVYTLFNKLKQSKVPLARRTSKLALFSTEYRKAIKAVAVLMPLLGIPHCLFMFKPKVLKYPDAYAMFNALLTSTQGFFVALIYCFLNREVKFVLKAKYRSFRGYLPSASRTRQTLDDSIGPVRRGNSAFRTFKQENDSNVFKCRSYRLPKPNNGSAAKSLSEKNDLSIEN